MVHDNDDYLSAPRAPSLGQGASTPFPDTPGPASLSTTPMPPSSILPDSRKISIISNRSDPASRIPPAEADNASMTSFKTCPSDSNINNLVPRQVSETYYKPPIPLPVVKPPQAPSVMTKSTPQAMNPARPLTPMAPPPAAPATPADSGGGGVRHLVRDRWYYEANGTCDTCTCNTYDTYNTCLIVKCDTWYKTGDVMRPMPPLANPPATPEDRCWYETWFSFRLPNYEFLLRNTLHPSNDDDVENVLF